jgi:lipopolysaccharide export system protein LptC
MPVGPGLYSRMVAILKVSLPLVALGLLAALFLIQTDERLGGELVFSKGDIAALGTGQRITDAIFSGTTRDEDRFRFVAAQVIPDAAPPTRAAITTLSGGIDFAGGLSVKVQAASGDLDIPAQRLGLSGDVQIETSDGYRMAADAVMLDLRDGTLSAGDAVETEGPMGRIDSRTLSIVPADGGGQARLFSFGDGVRLVYDPRAIAD